MTHLQVGPEPECCAGGVAHEEFRAVPQDSLCRLRAATAQDGVSAILNEQLTVRCRDVVDARLTRVEFGECDHLTVVRNRDFQFE